MDQMDRYFLSAATVFFRIISSNEVSKPKSAKEILLQPFIQKSHLQPTDVYWFLSITNLKAERF